MTVCCPPTHGIAKEAAEDRLDCIHMSVCGKPLEKAKRERKKSEDHKTGLAKKKSPCARWQICWVAVEVRSRGQTIAVQDAGGWLVKLAVRFVSKICICDKYLRI